MVWLFCGFFGLTMVMSSEGQDAEQYVLRLEQYHHSDTRWNALVSSFYAPSSNNVDVLNPIITFLVAFFTDQSRFLFMAYGLIFGFFYSRNIWYLIERYAQPIRGPALWLLICFAMIVGLWQINGFRFWTAAHIFLFGALPMLCERKLKYAGWAVLAVLMHFAYLLPVVVLLSYRLVGPRLFLLLAFFIGTFFVSQLNVEFIQNAVNQLPVAFEERAEIYTSPVAIDRFQDREVTFNWYITWAPQLFRWFLIGGIVLLVFQPMRLTPEMKWVAGFALLFGGVANLTSLIPSGGRFITVSNFFLAASIFWFLQYWGKRWSFYRYAYAAIPVMALFLVVAGRYLSGGLSLLSVLGNPIIGILVNAQTAIIELIK